MSRHVTPASSLSAGLHLESALPGLRANSEGLDLGRPVGISLRDQNSLLILKVMDYAMLYSNLQQLYDG